MIRGKYFIGLDMGTASLGWAVTDVNYKLIRRKGKDLWGVRLFEEAQTSEGRRGFRISRRRRQREIARMGALRELFADEINKIDARFFLRLDESKYHKEDKNIDSKYSIFNDKDFNDKDYYTKYPTIFHLRKELIESNKPHDIRFIYLAVANMFKHRGHFLNAGLDSDGVSGNLEVFFRELNNVVEDRLGIAFKYDIDIKVIEEILSNKEFTKTKKTEEIATLLQINKSKDKQAFEIIKGIAGQTFKLSQIFLLDVEEKDNKYNFKEMDEEKENKILQVISEEDFTLIESMKSVHDCGILATVKKGFDYLSQARVALYEKHKADLIIFKDAMCKYAPDYYNSMFRYKEIENKKKKGENKEKAIEPGSYSAYVNSVNSKGFKQRRNVSGRTQDDLYKSIKKHLEKVKGKDEQVEYILKEISKEKETFLPKQLTNLNGVIPNQVHLAELKVILKNAEGYLPFLAVKDESGFSPSEKIIQLFEFKIPYYIGPLLAEEHSGNEGNGWVIRKVEGRVYPWNFEEKIDTTNTAVKFIERMVRHCTYIQGELSLPKNSLLYERFCVLNELNNLCIRGEKPSVELKQAIYEDLFMEGKPVKQKDLIKYLVSKGTIGKNEKGIISGIDTDFKNYLSSIGKFKGVLGEEISKDSNKKIIEDIIFWGTVYGNDKRFYKEKINEVYGRTLSKEQLKRIYGFKFNDWGNLSRSFLNLEGCDKSTGEVQGIISAMWNTNNNLMELFTDKFTYNDELNNLVVKTDRTLSEIEYEDLKDMYLSAPVRRMVWQTLLVLKEVEEAMGYEPERIFVEMAKGGGEKGKRTVSRKDKFVELYKNCKKEEKDWSEEIKNTPEQNFQSKKLYLYYTQKGRCMYSGETIKLDDLFKDNLYDIDHIYPRHFVKDDSLEKNLVLVKKEYNAHKTDNYPIEEDIFRARISYWQSLLTIDMKDGFITKEKYNRLINRNPFTDEQLEGFINRQLVETRQGTKAITSILSQCFKDTEIAYVKGGNVSDFRHKYDLLKTRIVNDFHHAQDAYLNIVVGNVYNMKFTKNPMNFVKAYRKNAEANPYHMEKIFDFNVKRGGEIGWISSYNNNPDASIKIVKEVMGKTTPIITRMNFEAHGGIAKQMMRGAKVAKSKSYLSLKSKDIRIKDVTKYGGYSDISTAYFFLVEHEKKEKCERTLETVPIYVASRIKSSPKALLDYCVEVLELKNPRICVEKIKIQSLIKKDGYYLYIAGKTNDQISLKNAIPLKLNQKQCTYIKNIEKAVERDYFEKDMTLDENIELYNVLKHKHTNCIFAKKPNSIGDKLSEGLQTFKGLSIKKQCINLLEILKLTELNNNTANLVDIGGSSSGGKININKNITGAKEFKIINQSPAGLHEKEIDLLKI